MTAAGLGAGLLSALAASVCCIGPIAAATLGLGSLGALTRFESLRPWLTGLTILFLAVAFFLTYRTRTPVDCAPGSLCEVQGPGRVGRVNRMVLWISTVIVLIVLTFPIWVNWIL